jgi:hypothetical protein
MRFDPDVDKTCHRKDPMRCEQCFATIRTLKKKARRDCMSSVAKRHDVQETLSLRCKMERSTFLSAHLDVEHSSPGDRAFGSCVGECNTYACLTKTSRRGERPRCTFNALKTISRILSH